jgi:hypothetical protein
VRVDITHERWYFWLAFAWSGGRGFDVGDQKRMRMDWLTAAWLGGAGGALVEAIALHGYLTNWQEARRRGRHDKDAELPTLDQFIDIPADTLVAITRLVLGAAAGLVFHTQINGVAAAVAVGAAAPALLQQLGTFRAIRDAVQHDPGSADSAGEALIAGTRPATMSTPPADAIRVGESEATW